MSNLEENVRTAAAGLSKAITEAEAAGLRVTWPANAGRLDAIAISETKKAVAAGAPAKKGK